MSALWAPSGTPIRGGGVQSPSKDTATESRQGERVIDRITITGLTAIGHHGVFPVERRDGQTFVADVELGLGLDTRSDDLSTTVNYAEVADQVVDVLIGDPCNLIETVAGRIADRCLSFDRISEVVVTVHKPQAPVLHEFTDLSVTIHRSRHDQRPL